MQVEFIRAERAHVVGQEKNHLHEVLLTLTAYEDMAAATVLGMMVKMLSLLFLILNLQQKACLTFCLKCILTAYRLRRWFDRCVSVCFSEVAYEFLIDMPSTEYESTQEKRKGLEDQILSSVVPFAILILKHHVKVTLLQGRLADQIFVFFESLPFFLAHVDFLYYINWIVDYIILHLETSFVSSLISFLNAYVLDIVLALRPQATPTNDTIE
ncbi:hypothetical protein ACJX0J_018017 [Zea mays]